MHGPLEVPVVTCIFRNTLKLFFVNDILIRMEKLSAGYEMENYPRFLHSLHWKCSALQFFGFIFFK